MGSLSPLGCESVRGGPDLNQLPEPWMVCIDPTAAAIAWGWCSVIYLNAPPRILECISQMLLSPNLPKADSSWGIPLGSDPTLGRKTFSCVLELGGD